MLFQPKSIIHCPHGIVLKSSQTYRGRTYGSHSVEIQAMKPDLSFAWVRVSRVHFNEIAEPANLILTEDEEERRGRLIAESLGLKENGGKGLYMTHGGKKTLRGLFNHLRGIILDGE